MLPTNFVLHYLRHMALKVAKPMWEPVLAYDSEKAVQCIDYFVEQEGGRIEKLKVIKLLYLADRLSLAKRDKPLIFDEYFSMRHGPVTSASLNGINGEIADPAWKKIELLKDNRSIISKDSSDRDRLSKADLRILTETWEEFGKMSASQIRAWTHDNCPEYSEVEGGRLPISLDEILRAVGNDDPVGTAHDLRQLQATLGNLARVSAH